MSGESYTAGAVDRHDPIADLIGRIREAAQRGEPLAAGATVTVRKVRQGLFRVERP